MRADILVNMFINAKYKESDIRLKWNLYSHFQIYVSSENFNSQIYVNFQFYLYEVKVFENPYQE